MNKVTLQGIMDKVKGATYTLLPSGRTTVCELTMENGFTIKGYSGVVDIKMYNKFLGEKHAYDDAINNIWPFEGYLLAQKMHDERQKADAACRGAFPQPPRPTVVMAEITG
jgi:hypothetical protein